MKLSYTALLDLLDYFQLQRRLVNLRNTEKCHNLNNKIEFIHLNQHLKIQIVVQNHN